MNFRHAKAWAVAVVIGALLLSGCASSTAQSLNRAPISTTTRTSKPPISLVALGDSVPSGGGCGCTPFPELTGSWLSASSGHQVSVVNDAVGGATSTSVLASLTTDPAVRRDVAAADVVEIQVGANDVGYNDKCGPDASCYRSTVPTVQSNLTQIIGHVHTLRRGRPVVIALLDYWNVWLGGKYATKQGPEYVKGASDVTDQVNDVILQTATTTGTVYIDLKEAFKGPAYSYDETHFLADDGDHPNASGHQQIARAVVEALAPRFA